MKSFNTLFIKFLNHCRYEKRLSEKTLSAYTTDITQFDNFLRKCMYGEPTPPQYKALIQDYLRENAHLKPKTLKRKIATLKSLFNFAEYEDLISVNPFRKMKVQIKQDIPLPKTLTIEEIQSILSTAYEQIKSQKLHKKHRIHAYRDILIFEILFGTGIRVSELVSLKMKDLDLVTGRIIINGKGRKQRLISVPNTDVLDILRKYCPLLTKAEYDPNSPLLVNRYHKALSDQSVRHLVKKYALLAGIGKEVTPHMFRHSFASLLLENNVDIRYIQSLLGHSSITVTQIYTHINSRKEREILAEKHPRALMKF